jgi:tetratricopeptide (TPR) repeat protein
MISGIWKARFVAATLVALVAVAGAPVFAQNTAVVKGKVTDADGKPIEKAKIVIDFKGGVENKRELSTNRRGEFVQVGLAPGPYLITASKDGVGVSEEAVMLRVGDAPELVLALRPAAAAAASEADQAFRKVFGEAVAFATADKYDEAIAKFTEAAGMRADCYACYMNIGNSYYQKDDHAKAEVAFKKAIEVSPSEPKPYQALADLYSAMGKRTEAAEMTTKAVALGGAAASVQDLYNNGVNLWNAGKFAEAKAQFEAAIKTDPNYADAQYWVGMATLNAGDMANAVQYFENYLKLAPTGEFAEQAKGVVASIKPQ